MPIYEYECEWCAEVREVLHEMNATPPEQCPDCGGRLERVFSSTSLNLGRYVSPSAERHTRSLTIQQQAKKEERRLAEHAKKTGIRYDDLFEDHHHQ